MSRRCGVTSAGGAYGCCRETEHGGGLHCAHPGAELTGTPGRIVASRSLLGLSFADCDGTAHPTGDRIVHSTQQGAVQSRFELIPPTEGDTP